MSAIIDIIFPKTCTSCNSEGAHLCDDCASLIPINRSVSPIVKSSSLAGLFSATSYQNDLVKYIIRTFKYSPFLKDLSVPLSSLIIAHFSLLDKPFRPSNPQSRHSYKNDSYILCSIPLHTRRLKWRGFNQAEAIAILLSQATDTPFAIHAMTRIQHSPPQATLREEQRKKNIRGAFKVDNKEAIVNKNVLLVDDVYTSGATMEEAARTLRKSGARKVYGVVVARD